MQREFLKLIEFMSIEYGRFMRICSTERFLSTRSIRDIGAITIGFLILKCRKRALENCISKSFRITDRCNCTIE